jgi:hypothetical protein
LTRKTPQILTRRSVKTKTKTKDDPKSQVAAFRKAARELGCDESEERFQETLRALGRAKPQSPHKGSRQKPKSTAD